MAAAASLAVANNGATNNKIFQYGVGLWGDMPCSDVQARTGVPNLIADVNRSDIDFSVHDGDLKAGNNDVHGVRAAMQHRPVRKRREGATLRDCPKVCVTGVI